MHASLPRVLTFALILAFLAAGALQADPQRLAELSRPENADKLVGLARQGDPDACYLVGIIAMQGGEKEQSRALLETGAAKGSLDCLAALGQAWEKGMFGEASPTLALSLYLKAAEKGHGVAMLKLGNMYREGAGIPQDYKRGFAWSGRAARAGVRQAMINLGLHYMMGWGTEKNPVKAFAVYYIAGVESEVAKAQAFLIYEKLTDQQRMEAEVVMMEWEKIYPPPPKKEE